MKRAIIGEGGPICLAHDQAWLFYFILFLSNVTSVLFSPFSIAITSLGEERDLVLVLFVGLFDLRLFGFVCFLFILVSGKGSGL